MAYDQRARRPKDLVCVNCNHGNSDGKLVLYSDGNIYCWSCGHLNTTGGTGEVKQGKFEWTPQVYKEIPQLVINDYTTIPISDNFTQFLIGRFEPNDVLAARKLYRFGTDPISNRTSFISYDIEQRARYIKSVQYLSSGKRDKSVIPYVPYRSKDGFKACLYGEHLLNSANRQKSINLVESEKSAIIASIAFPDQIWLATAGSHGLTYDKAQHLRGMVVNKWVDMDKAGRLVDRDRKVLAYFNSTMIVKDIDPSRNDGADIADIILENN